MSGSLQVTQVGRKVATSGLCPDAAAFFLEELPRRWPEFEKLMPASGSTEGFAEGDASYDVSDLAFALFHLALASPEYERAVPAAPRISLYQLGDRRESDRAMRVEAALTVRPWDRNVFAVNGAALAVDWINGAPLRELEGRFPDLRGGSLTGLFRDLGQILAGVSEVVIGATNMTLPAEDRAAFPVEGQTRLGMRRLVSLMRRLCRRLERGLPDDIMWIVELRRTGNSVRGRRLVSNSTAMALFGAGFSSPESLADRGRTNALSLALRALHPSPSDYVKEIRESLAEWRQTQSEALRDRQASLVAEECKAVVHRLYRARNTDLEDCLSDIFGCLRIEVADRDGPGKNSFPDLVLNALAKHDIVIECKSKIAANGEVSLDDASDVLRKALLNGFSQSHKVTVCQPMLSPDVVRKIDQCPELTIVNVQDLAEAFVRLHRRKLETQDIVNWLTTPGQARREELPYRSSRD